MTAFPPGEAVTALRGASVAEQIRRDTAAVRLRHSKFGVRRSLGKEQIEQAAATFKAQKDYLSARKKLIDTTSEEYRRVTAAIGAARQFWRSVTVPYPESGIRLIRRDRIEEFNSRMLVCRIELASAVAALDQTYSRLREESRSRLGDLFDAADYPASLLPEFSLAWEYPSVEPPDYLRELNPALWRREQERIAQRFEEAVQMAEAAFTDEFAKLVTHLTERLQGGEDGKPRVVRSSAVDNLKEFFERFRSLNVRSNEDLDRLVSEAAAAVQGIEVDKLRTDASVRASVAESLGQIRGQLDALVVDRPIRAITLEDE